MLKAEQGKLTTHQKIQFALKSSVPTDLKKTIIRMFLIPLAKEANMEHQFHQFVMQDYFKRLAKDQKKDPKVHQHKRTHQSFLDQHCLRDELYHLRRLLFINLFYQPYANNYSYYHYSQINYFSYYPLRLLVNLLRKVVFAMRCSSPPCQNNYFRI